MRLCGSARTAGVARGGPAGDRGAGRNADGAQRPYMRLYGSAGTAGAARDGAAGDRDGGRNADGAQRPYMRLRGSAGMAGAARDGAAGDRDGRNADGAQRPYMRLRGSAGTAGATRDGAAGDRDGQTPMVRNDPICGCVGRPGPRGTVRPAIVTGETPMARNDPICGCVGRPGRPGPRGTERPAIVTGETPMVRNDPVCGCVGRPGRPGPRGTVRPAIVTAAETPMVRNDPICGRVGGPGRVGRGAARDGAAGDRGRWRNADGAQRPYMRPCGRAGPGRSGSRARRCGRRSWPLAKRGWCATTLYAAAWIGRAARGGAAGDRGGVPNMDTEQRPYTRLCGSAGRGGKRSGRSGPVLCPRDATVDFQRPDRDAEFSENRSISRWCPGAESNHRHCDFQSHALPTELPGHSRATLTKARGIPQGDQAIKRRGAVQPTGGNWAMTCALMPRRSRGLA